MKDLRQTLQRELKIQTLPNDDASDDSTIPSPAMVRKLYPQKGTGISNASAANMGFSTGSHFSSASSPSSAATLSLSSSTTAAVKPMTVSSVTQISDTRGMVVRRDLEQDINFQYLKHVVLKFMLSRESEVSMYSNLTVTCPKPSNARCIKITWVDQLFFFLYCLTSAMFPTSFKTTVGSTLQKMPSHEVNDCKNYHPPSTLFLFVL